jgi:hypothetical protein
MPGRICVDLKIVAGAAVGCRLEKFRAEREDFVVSLLRVIDPQVKMDLLRISVRPLRWTVARRELNSHPRPTVDVHHMPVIFRIDRPIE